MKCLFKKVSLQLSLKLSIELVSLINLGRAFHNLGAANTKARSPRASLRLIFGKLSKVPSLELKLYLDTGLEVIKKLKYEGARLLKIFITWLCARRSHAFLSFERCEASRLLAGSKMTFAIIFAFFAAHDDAVCCFLIHAASHEEVDVGELLVPDKASGFRLITFLGITVHVTVFQWFVTFAIRTFWIKIVG